MANLWEKNIIITRSRVGIDSYCHPSNKCEPAANGIMLRTGPVFTSLFVCKGGKSAQHQWWLRSVVILRFVIGDLSSNPLDVVTRVPLRWPCCALYVASPAGRGGGGGWASAFDGPAQIVRTLQLGGVLW